MTNDASELYKITVLVMGHGHGGDETVIHELAFALEELDKAAREFTRICYYGGGISWKYVDKVVYCPYHSIVRVETGREVYDRALELERERMPKFRVWEGKKGDA